MEIPVAGKDLLLSKYTITAGLPERDVWREFFVNTLESWANWSGSDATQIVAVRTWIYICLQRNLRWTDVITYWIEAVYATSWLGKEGRASVLAALAAAESGNGWILVTSYRIPIMWEHVHLGLATLLRKWRSKPGI
jgi:hypothetical protein